MINKFKKILHRCFMDQTMNMVIFSSFCMIILIQFIILKSEWISEHINKAYSLIENSHLATTIVSIFFPILLGAIIKLIKKRKKYSQVFEGKIEKTNIFPGLITHDMINKKDVVLVKNRTFEDVSDIQAVNFGKPMILDREQQCNNIMRQIEKIHSEKGCLNCLFLTGASGAGKSIILNNFLLKKLNEASLSGKSVCVIRNNYNEYQLIYQKLRFNDYSIVIMDQFEESLNNVKIYDVICELADESIDPILFIFSFPQEYFDKIYTSVVDGFYKFKMEKYDKFKDKDDVENLINSSTYFIRNDNHDVEEIITLINSFIGESDNVERCLADCKKYALNNKSFLPLVYEGLYSPSLIFLCSILAKIEINDSPLVEFSLLSYIYELFHDEIDSNLEEYIDDSDKVIDLYLNKWAMKFPDVETAQMILYLLSDKNIYTEKDLKCVTFKPTVCFEETNAKSEEINIINALKSINFISVKKGYSGFNYGFTSIHDYAGNKMKEYCSKYLSTNIKQNIEHYQKIASVNKTGKSRLSESKEKHDIYARYIKYNNHFHQSVINLFAFVILIGSGICGIYNFWHNPNCFYMFITVNCMLSTYYIYNVIYNFFRELNILYYMILSIIGGTAIVLCFAFPNYWGVFIGIEIVALGITAFILSTQTVNIAQSTFKQKGIVYLIIGFAIIGLGFSYSVDLYWNYHVLYCIYIFLCNITHMNYQYIIEMIGTANTIQYKHKF